jgi:hypothetical protein
MQCGQIYKTRKKFAGGVDLAHLSFDVSVEARFSPALNER